MFLPHTLFFGPIKVEFGDHHEISLQQCFFWGTNTNIFCINEPFTIPENYQQIYWLHELNINFFIRRARLPLLE